MSRHSAPCYVVRIGSAGRYVGCHMVESGYGVWLSLDLVDRQQDAIRLTHALALAVADAIDPIDAVVVRLTPSRKKAG